MLNRQRAPAACTYPTFLLNRLNRFVNLLNLQFVVDKLMGKKFAAFTTRRGSARRVQSLLPRNRVLARTIANRAQVPYLVPLPLL